MSKMYDEYLQQHIEAVQKAIAWIDENTSIIKEELSPEEITLLHQNIAKHDASKYSIEEYDAYDQFFYGEKDLEVFNRAWLHHIHCNLHHWQHWCLIEKRIEIPTDKKESKTYAFEYVPLEMPKVYVLEMIADWWSFSWRTGDLREIFDWYNEHKDIIAFHPNTRKFVERILNEIDNKL